jgi:general stress protein YciG
MKDDNAEISTLQPSAPAPSPQQPARSKRGFASMNPAQIREFARRGGAAAHRAGTAHEFTTEEARAAGRKGGLAARLRRRATVL